MEDDKIKILGVIGYAIYTNNQSENKDHQNKTDNSKLETNEIKTEFGAETNIEKENKKVLVVYYSAQSHTKAVAEKIANNLKADLFEIVPEEIYTTEDLDWTDRLK